LFLPENVDMILITIPEKRYGVNIGDLSSNFSFSHAGLEHKPDFA
jgi:hypothetical protein